MNTTPSTEKEKIPDNIPETQPVAVDVAAEVRTSPEAETERRRGGKPPREPSVRVSIILAAVAVGLLAVSLTFYFIASNYPQWISDEYKHFSRWIQHIFGSFWSLIPFSGFEILIYIAVIRVIAGAIVTAVRAVRWKGALRRWGRYFAVLFLAASVLLSMFCVTWAPNYHSAGLAYELGLEVRERSPEVLKAALEEITDQLGAVAEELPRDSAGEVMWSDFSDRSYCAAEAWEALAAAEPFFADCKPLPAKPVLASRGMSYTGITGIFQPFTGEASVNADFPATGQIFTMAHEIAHSMGCAAENEANFAALLACRASDDPLARYSGLLAAFTYCYNALVSVDRDAAYQCWYDLPEQAVADYAQRSEYWAQFEGEIQKVAESVNDSYLKTMNQPSGVKSYGEVVDLILADFVQRTGYTEAE